MKNKKKNAKFVYRFLAFIIDFIIVSLIASLVYLPFSAKNDTSLQKLSDEITEVSQSFVNGDIDANTFISEYAVLNLEVGKFQGTMIFIEIIISLLYFVVFQVYNDGQTIGKSLLKIKLKSTVGDLSMNQVLFRSLIINTILFNIIEFIMICFTKSPITYLCVVGTFELIQYLFIIISMFMVMFSNSHRGLHDHLFKTEVICV